MANRNANFVGSIINQKGVVFDSARIDDSTIHVSATDPQGRTSMGTFELDPSTTGNYEVTNLEMHPAHGRDISAAMYKRANMYKH